MSIGQMSIEDYDAVFALLQATPGIRLGSADCREAMERYLLRNPGMSFVAHSGNRLLIPDSALFAPWGRLNDK